MSGVKIRAAHLTLDVHDIDRVAEFWSALLGVEITNRQPEWADLGPLGHGGPILSLQWVPEPKTVKNRMHLDLAVDAASGGVVGAGQRALALGGTPATDVYGSQTSPWQVWRDPEGNEFCLFTDSTPDGAPRGDAALDVGPVDVRAVDVESVRVGDMRAH